MQCQLAHIYNSQRLDTLSVEMAPVQQQVGGKDCGLFAVAFATELANGGDPVKVQYDQCAMREHYYSCLEGGEL